MDNKWIVIGEKDGKAQLVSKEGVSGLLPKGSFLTIQQDETKFILRVENSGQTEIYKPSPMIVDMDLAPLEHDRHCKNIISAVRLYVSTTRADGLIEYLKPQSEARQSSQKEIAAALEFEKNKGPRVFIASVQYNQNQILTDCDGAMVSACLPESMFFHQTLVCGKTGSGKTVGLKHFIKYFVEELEGAVLAVNVKEEDLLHMDKASKTTDAVCLKEWAALGVKPEGVTNFSIYYPANMKRDYSEKVDDNRCEAITLDVHTLDPESLVGLLQNISDAGSLSLPGIFRAWRDKHPKEQFTGFVDYFQRGVDNECQFDTHTERGDKLRIRLHRGTFDNILRNLTFAVEFFDNKEAVNINADHVLSAGKVSVIDVGPQKAKLFGSVILRQLLHEIVEAKSQDKYDIPILIIIDEVHTFYNSSAAQDALGDLDTICRTGRSKKIGIVFASQDPKDIPPGLNAVINTKIFFKSDPGRAKDFGVSMTTQELESLKAGFALVSVHDLPQLRVVKFPLALAGVGE